MASASSSESPVASATDSLVAPALASSMARLIPTSPRTSSANRDIKALIAERWQTISSELAETGPTPEEVALVQEISAGLARLETQARARLVWADDFDEYMRNALAPRGK